MKLVVCCLLGMLAGLPACAWSQEGPEFILQDTVAQLLVQLAARGTSGAHSSVLVPRETYEVTLEEPESGRPGSYLIHRAPVRAEVEQWKIESATFTAARVTFLSPAIQLYQGTAASIENHLRQSPLPAAGTPEGKDVPGGGLSLEPTEVANATNILEWVQNRDSLFRVEKMEVRQGTLLVVDTLASPVRSLRIEQIDLDMSGLVTPDKLREKPLDLQLAMEVQSASPGRLEATLHEASRKNLANFRFHCNVDNLDISLLAPFLPLQEYKIQSGIAGLVLDASCVDNEYSSRNRLSFKSLNVEGGSGDSWFSDLTAKVLAKAGSAVYEDVQLDFNVSGDLSNRDFDLGDAYSEAFQSALLRWTTLQALRKLGFSEE